jgi:hypothetical protein
MFDLAMRVFNVCSENYCRMSLSIRFVIEVNVKSSDTLS